MDTEAEDEPSVAPDARTMHTAEQRLAAAMQAHAFPGLPPTPTDDDPPAPPEGPSDTTAWPHRIGRYAIEHELGRGGMGVVYVGRDDQLERQVAVKLLRGRYSDLGAKRRLQREAQALAKLSHPSVVQVYECSEHHGELFLAMELVEGQTLRRWLAEAHDWRTIARALREAGAGLEAAHAVDLVHRDFKPDNAIVSPDGRVRVLDFGLVQLGTLPPLTHDDGGPDTSLAEGDDDTTDLHKLTCAGAVLGTPAYMAPEQFAASPCDASTDQFSFCVTAFEALFGRRPFRGDNFGQLRAAVYFGEVAQIPRGSAVPQRLRDAITRGLSRDPQERWPSMTTLLAEFDAVLDTGRRTRRLAWALGAVALGATAAAFALGTADEATPPCEFQEGDLAPTWSDEDRRALHAASAARTLPFAAQTARRLDQRLTGWATRWHESQVEACEATHVHGTQSASMLDLRTGCLERQRRETREIVDLLATPDGSGLARAFELVERLPEVEACGDPRLAETTHPLPRDPARRQAVLGAFGQLGRLRSLGHIGRLDEIDQQAESLATTVESLGFPPLTLDLAYLTAQRDLWRMRREAGLEKLRAAIRQAEIAGQDELSATLRTDLASYTVGLFGRIELQQATLAEAELAVARLDRPRDRRVLELGFARALLLESQGDFGAAMEQYRSLREQADARNDQSLVARVQESIAHHLVHQGRFDEAERSYADARAAFEAAWGPRSIFDAELELHLGLLDLERGRFDAAQGHLDLARERLVPLVSPDDSNMSLLELMEAKLAFIRGDLTRAAQGFGRVAESATDDERLAEAWDALGVIRFYRGEFTESLDAYERAKRHYLATHGPDHPQLGLVASNMGESLAAVGDHQGAQAAFSEALDVLGRALPVDHPDLALPYKGRAQSRLARGEMAAARVDLERALRLHEANPGEPVERADVEFTLARVLFEQGQSAPARSRAEDAERRLRQLGHEERAATITAWLDEHR